MNPVSRSITNQHRSVTNYRTPIAGNDQNGNLTALHLQILQWVEGRTAGQTRPQLANIAPFLIDRAVAELVLGGLVKAVSVPQSRYDSAHWEPTALTASGWRVLARHRRAQPRPTTHPWWRIFGRSRHS